MNYFGNQRTPLVRDRSVSAFSGIVKGVIATLPAWVIVVTIIVFGNR